MEGSGFLYRAHRIVLAWSLSHANLNIIHVHVQAQNGKEVHRLTRKLTKIGKGYVHILKVQRDYKAPHGLFLQVKLNSTDIRNMPREKLIAKYDAILTPT